MEWISNLQVNLPAGKDGNRYHIPWRRQLMMFREAFHLSLRLQKMKLPFPTIKDPGKVGEQNIYKICTQKNILTPLWKFSLRFVIWNLMIATIKVINERKSHVLPLLILISWRGCCFCFCSDQWYPLCALATGGLFVYRYHFSFCIFCHCLFVFTTLICLSSFDLTAHFLSLFVMTDAVEVAQTVWVVFALSGWQLPSWLFFCPRTSSSMELLFITRALHLSLSNQLNRYKDSINCQIHKWMPIHQVLRSKIKPFFPGPFVPGSHSLWVSDHSKWTKQWKLWRSWTADRKQ